MPQNKFHRNWRKIIINFHPKTSWYHPKLTDMNKFLKKDFVVLHLIFWTFYWSNDIQKVRSWQTMMFIFSHERIWLEHPKNQPDYLRSLFLGKPNSSGRIAVELVQTRPSSFFPLYLWRIKIVQNCNLLPLFQPFTA